MRRERNSRPFGTTTREKGIIQRQGPLKEQNFGGGEGGKENSSKAQYNFR